jgi:hypothetical protein
MPIRLNDEHCLLWIKDPSVSPFENKDKDQDRKIRKNIFNEEKNKNPKSFLRRIKRKCFYKSDLRQKIVDQINEYKSNKTLRLYKLKDEINNSIEYITPPFTIEECERWLENHLENPRFNKTKSTPSMKVYDKITLDDPIYIELIYTSLQYGLSTPAYLANESPTLPDKINEWLEKKIHKNLNKLIKNIKIRLQFMNENDKYFTDHNVESFDKNSKIKSFFSKSKIVKKKKSSDVLYSSSIESLNLAEKKQLRDLMLEEDSEKKAISEYIKKKNFIVKNKNVDNTIFLKLKKLLDELNNEVMNGNNLINFILKNESPDDTNRIIIIINKYFKDKGYSNSEILKIVNENNLNTIEGIIKTFIKNTYIQLINPSIVIPSDIIPICLIHENNNYIKINFENLKLINFIRSRLIYFVHYYNNFTTKLNSKIVKYLKDIITDLIPLDYVKKRKDKGMEMIVIDNEYFYQNNYYEILYSIMRMSPQIELRLPEGMGLLLGKELMNTILEIDDINFDILKISENRIITDENPQNGFTYEECKNWVIMPIINPRTFKRILIDSSIYNSLLCISYQYDNKLIPRMITSRGHHILYALISSLQYILRKKRKQPQTREQLEKFIIDKEKHYKEEKEKLKIIPNTVGLKWKNIGMKQPKKGIEIIDKNLINAFLKLKDKNGEVPFYVFFSEEELTNLNITSIAKNSYINIATYYILDIDESSTSTINFNKMSDNYILDINESTQVMIKFNKVSDKKVINKKNNEFYIIKEIEQIKEIEEKGTEIINEKIINAILKSKNINGILPSIYWFYWSDFEEFGITSIAKNSYIKINNYYVPIFNKRDSDIKSDSKPVVITERYNDYIVKNYYTVAECLKWANQPNKNPKIPEILFTTDSNEYNEIFEQALIYDVNIIPINITPKGIIFMKSVIKNKKKFFITKKHFKNKRCEEKNIDQINTTICNAIKEIYEDETSDEGQKYKKFKEKMKKKCENYNKKTDLTIDELNIELPKQIKNIYKNTIYYYQDSALASILIQHEYENKKIYDFNLQSIYIQDFNNFNIEIYVIDDKLNERKTYAIDQGGPKRQFFTKLFEELFCDMENPTRPFISPPGIICNKYYINPNFAPDEKFKKVIKAYTQNYDLNIKQFNTEEDYMHIYYVIGKLLCITVVNEDLKLPQQLSSYILAGFIYQKEMLDKYDILYLYLQDFESAIFYINLIKNRDIKQDIKTIENCDISFNDLYLLNNASGISLKSSSEIVTISNYIEFILRQSNHVITKNFLVKENINSKKNMKKRYVSLFTGFSENSIYIINFLNQKNVTIEQLSNLITNEQLTDDILQEFANKIDVKIKVRYSYIDHNSGHSSNSYNGSEGTMFPNEKRRRQKEIKEYIQNIITRKRSHESNEDHSKFIKKLLLYWTGLSHYVRTKDYTITYMFGKNVDVNRFPEAHTCFNELVIYGFPADTDDKIYTPIMREKFIYDKLKIAIKNEDMEMP